MVKKLTIVLLALLVGALCAGVAPVHAADPVTIDVARGYVVVLNDGRLDVEYSLIFTENEGRS